MFIKKGDTVAVIAGNSKGKQGTVIRVDVKKNRVVIEGVNVVSRSTKPSQTNPDGGIIKKEASIDISNVMLLDPKTGETTRVGYRVEDGKKVRYAKKSGVTLK